MNRGVGIFVGNNKDEEKFGMFGKKELRRQQPHIRVYHCGSITTHDEKKTNAKELSSSLSWPLPLQLRKRKNKDDKGPLALSFASLEKKNQDNNELSSSSSWL